LALKSLLEKDHARDCLKYALDSMQTDPGDVPMVFPEVLLNAREVTVLELYAIKSPPHPERPPGGCVSKDARFPSRPGAL
jgi:hypothetical protein